MLEAAAALAMTVPGPAHETASIAAGPVGGVLSHREVTVLDGICWI
jgi:hypothetical protein